MSEDATCLEPDSDLVDLVIRARPRDLGGFSVRRVLPFHRRRSVGPFVFLDRMGPAAFAPGQGIDVRPHPHTGLATLTYLYEGRIFHRDSLGSALPIVPGEVNWMVAGHGIVHSERTPEDALREGQRLDGLQAWVALPLTHEDLAPSFEHHDRDALPSLTRGGATLTMVTGHGFGLTSPVTTFSPTLYADLRLAAGASFTFTPEHEERAVYLAHGRIACGGGDGHAFEDGELIVLKPGVSVALSTDRDTRLMLLGGAPLDGPRLMEWNFVASTAERMDAARASWRRDHDHEHGTEPAVRERRFPLIPGDDRDYIPY